MTIHFPRRSTHRVTWKPWGHGDHSFHPRWSLLKGRGTQQLNVTTQDDHHHTHVKPTHDAPIGSRTPAATGEDDPRKEWKVLVTFSVTQSQWSTARTLEPKQGPYCGQTVHWAHSPRRMRVNRLVTQSLAIPCIPGDTPVLRQAPNTVREEPTVLSTASLATQRWILTVSQRVAPLTPPRDKSPSL